MCTDFMTIYNVFHLKPARLASEIKKGFCFGYFLVDYMHTHIEDTGNEILVNQDIFVPVL
jgi:hypothetical protein